MVSYVDDAVGFIARGYEVININGNPVYVRDCKVDFEYTADEMHIIKTCTDINGNIRRFIRKIVYEAGKIKSVSGWEEV